MSFTNTSLLLLTLTGLPLYVDAAERLTFSDWLNAQNSRSQIEILKNISPSGAVPGAVAASPSRANPDYFYHWVRDASMATRELIEFYHSAFNSAEKESLLTKLIDRVHFDRKLQRESWSRSSSLGEPKYSMYSGAPYSGPWGRPQNDGPALRVLCWLQLIENLRQFGDPKNLIPLLYDSRFPTDSLIKTDLEYVAWHWNNPSYDVWEEEFGDHLATRILQATALEKGAKLAQELSDPYAAEFYRKNAQSIHQSIDRFYDQTRNYYVSVVNLQGSLPYKTSGLDSSLIFAINQTDSLEQMTEPRLVQTLQVLKQAFARLYPINANPGPGLAIGRYPEDRYDGYSTNGTGNPWVLLTLALSEYYSKTNQKQKAEDQLRKLYQIMNGRPGLLSEQINRSTGKMQGAPHLTWSYSAFRSALRAFSVAR